MSVKLQHQEGAQTQTSDRRPVTAIWTKQTLTVLALGTVSGLVAGVILQNAGMWAGWVTRQTWLSTFMSEFAACALAIGLYLLIRRVVRR
jgi:hypothetical protein